MYQIEGLNDNLCIFFFILLEGIGGSFNSIYTILDFAIDEEYNYMAVINYTLTIITA